MCGFRPGMLFVETRRPLCSSLFPYTTLFRSRLGECPLETADEEVQLRGLQSEEPGPDTRMEQRSEEHTSELQSRFDLVCRLLLEKKNRAEQLPAPRTGGRSATQNS